MTLAEMMARRDQWMSEKPSFDQSDVVNPQTNDIILGYFASNGNDDKRFFNIYRSHIFPQVSSSGKRFNAHRWCPKQSGEDQECQYCSAGHTDIKERMSMYFYVTNWLHAAMPQPRQGEAPKNWPQVPFEGGYYFNEVINGWRRWDTSAWKESPAQTIGKLGAMYGTLHGFMFQLTATGQGLTRRFSIFAIPNSAPLPPELYQEAMNTLEPIPDILRKELSVAVQINPQAATPAAAALPGLPAQPGTWVTQPQQQYAPTAQPTTLQPFAAPGVAPTVQPFVPAAPAPAAAPPPGAAGLVSSPVAAAPPSPAPAAPAAFVPAAPVVTAPAPEAVPAAPAEVPAPVPTTAEVPVSHPNEAVVIPVQDPQANVVVAPASGLPTTATPAEAAGSALAAGADADPRRPMQRMF